MQVTIALEQRFERTPDGAVWTQGVFARPFWDRYLDVFNSVNILARVREVPSLVGEWQCVDDERVSFAAVPHYLGLSQYLTKARQVSQSVRAAMPEDSAFILRVPGMMGSLVFGHLVKKGYPFGLEIVGDPYTVFSPGAVKSPLRPFFRWWFPRQLRHQAASACAVSYVTGHTLQKQYPAAPDAFTTHYSSIQLSPAAFVPTYRPYHEGRPFTLVTVGSLAQLYKAPDVLIDAVALCVQGGLDLRLVLVGDGKHRPELEARAAGLGLNGRACFRGEIPAGEAVRAQLDEADLFVLPSRTDALPRAIIEAMARALPCVGSTAGGIPELLPPDDLVPPDDAPALAAKIRAVLTDPERMARMSARNLDKAQEYGEDVLRERRITFYRQVYDHTHLWLH